MNKAEMNNVIIRYAEVNKAKNAAAAEVKELGEAIKEYFASREISSFECVGGVTATISSVAGRNINLTRLAAHFGGKVPDEFFDEVETVRLTVKEPKVKAALTAAKKGVVA